MEATMRSKPVFVAVVSISRHFGGREEGGWWYDWTTVESVERFDNPRRARRIARRIEREEARYAPRHNRYSVLGGADVEVRRARSLQEVEGWQTKHRPHYE
ncbi:MAG: hypothetical protein EBV77_07040 [Gemmatimonadaceae bacterium]|nr:hypothetical protein [Gemmatimonadaceae bacterium]